MPTDNTFKAATFRDANGVHVIARREESRADDIAGLHFFREVTEFLDAFHRNPAELFDVTEQWRGEALLFLVVETELDGIVAVTLLRLALQYAVGAGENDGHGRDDALRIIHARLAQFFSE